MNPVPIITPLSASFHDEKGILTAMSASLALRLTEEMSAVTPDKWRHRTHPDRPSDNSLQTNRIF
jgi:hypothetical protein